MAIERSMSVQNQLAAYVPGCNFLRVVNREDSAGRDMRSPGSAAPIPTQSRALASRRGKELYLA